MIFLTVNDEPGGVYKSQVIEVIRYLNSLQTKQVKLVSLVSWRNYRKNRRQIKKWLPAAAVLPMFPGIRFWKLNILILLFIKGFRQHRIIARNPMAFWLAHRLNKNTIYDGRGAVGSELTEYPDMIHNLTVVNSIKAAEAKAVKHARFRIAVSEKLIDHWRQQFNYQSNEHVVIPCTITACTIPAPEIIAGTRQELGFNERDIVLIYSGSTAGWQSFSLLNDTLEKMLANPAIKIIFLSPPSSLLHQFMLRFPQRASQHWVKPDEVHTLLCAADYGLLIREENKTNQTASPVKFGEYLNAGLKVIISKNIGDFSEITKDKKLGFVLNGELPELSPVEYEERIRMNKYAHEHLEKRSFESEYRKLFAV